MTLDHTSSIADGLLPVRPGDLTFAHARTLVHEVITVDEDGLADAVRFLAREAKIVVEPSGAATVAAIRQRFGSPDRLERTTVAVLSGGNMGLEKLAAIFAGA